MSQKAEVKVVVNTAEAQAALKRLEAEALRVESEVSRTGRKAKAGNYKNAKATAEAGHAEHQSPIAGGASGVSVAAAAISSAAAQSIIRVDKTSLNSKGQLRAFLTDDPAQKGFNKGSYRNSFSSYLSSAKKINPNLTNVLAAAHTEFFVMDGLDKSRLMAASMKVSRSRIYNLYGWWLGKDPKEKWMNIYKNDVAEQIKKNYSAMGSGEISSQTPSKKKGFSLVGSFKKLGQSFVSRGFGLGGSRALMNNILGIGLVGMAINQLGSGSPKRLDALRKGGQLGYAGHVIGTGAKTIYEFAEDIGYNSWKLIAEAGGFLYSGPGIFTGAILGMFGGDGKVKDAQQLALSIDKYHENAKNKRGGVDKYNPFLLQGAKEVGDHLTEKGRFGTPEENRRWALDLMRKAQEIAAKRAGLGNQG